MTNEQAIEILRKIDLCVPTGVIEPSDFYLALDLAIKALETGEIYITGEDYNLYMEGYKAGKKDFEPKQGEWILQPHSMIMRCSLCGNEETAKDIGTINPDKHFCSFCGAKMGGTE